MERTFTIEKLDGFSRNHTVFTKEALENAIKSVEDGTTYIYVNQNPDAEPGFTDIVGIIKGMELNEENNSVMVKAEMLDTYTKYEKLFGHLVQAGASNVSMSCRPLFEAQDDDVYLSYLNLKLDVPPSQRKQ